MSAVSDSIKTSSYAKVYLLYGSEAYLRRYYKNALKAALVNEGDNLNYAYFEGKDINRTEVLSQISTMPFMAEHRVVIVENSGWFGSSKGSDGEDSEEAPGHADERAAKGDEFSSAIAEMPDDVILIFSEEKADKRSKLFKAVSKAGIAEEFGEQTDESVARWLINQARAEGKVMAPATAMYLVSEAGRDMLLLENEFKKLTAYAADRQEITVKDVDTVSTHQVNNRIFDMISAIAAHRQREALKLYDDLLTLREAPFHILALLVRQYNQMLSIKDGLSRGYSPKVIEEKTGVKDWIVRKNQGLLSTVTLSDIERCLRACAATDEAIKQGNITDKLGVELLLIEMSEK